MKLTERLNQLNLPFGRVRADDLPDYPRVIVLILQGKATGQFAYLVTSDKLFNRELAQKQLGEPLHLLSNHESVEHLLTNNLTIYCGDDFTSVEQVIVTSASLELLVVPTLAFDKLFPGIKTLACTVAIDSSEPLGELPVLGQKTVLAKLTGHDDVPVVPSIAQKILQCHSDPNADVADLTQIVEQSPSLAAQVIKWAASPFYGYPGEITCVNDAIVKVLGFEMVMNLALGVALNNNFQVSVEGPIGLQNYWQHSVYTAALMELLAKACPEHFNKEERATAYLSGLLHNFGFLLVGQLYPNYFKALNQLIECNPHIPVVVLEKRLLGISHDLIGATLMEQWQLPAVVAQTAAQHHQAEYDGDNKKTIALVNLAIALLKRKELGDATSPLLQEDYLDCLGLSEEQCMTALEEIIENQEQLDKIVDRFS